MTMFQIVELAPDGSTIPLEALGLFPSGKLASTLVPDLMIRHPGKKFQPRPVAAKEDWRKREQNRFDDGTYQPLPWELPPIPNHFAHRSPAKPTEEVEFTLDAEWGAVDRKTRWTANRYLERFYRNMSISDRRRLVWEFSGEKLDDQVRITQDADEIEHYYTHGPISCMAHDVGEYIGEFHPTRCYAGPDLALAIIPDPSDDYYCIARCVVWPDKKIYNPTAYGDRERIYLALQQMGYSPGSIEGARLRTAAEQSSGEWDGDWYDGWTCPYIDGHFNLRYEAPYLIIDPTGPFCVSPSGIAYFDGVECECCGRTVSSNVIGRAYNYGNELKRNCCSHCREEQGYVYCVASNCWYLKDDQRLVALENNRYVLKAYSDHYSFICPITQTRWAVVDSKYDYDTLTRYSPIGFDQLMKQRKAAA